MKNSILLLLFVVLFSKLAAQDVPPIYYQLESNYEKSEFDACIKLAKDIDRMTASRLDTVAANSLFYLADSYLQSGDQKMAVTYFEKEKVMRSKLPMGDGINYSTSLFNLAYAYLEAGQYTNAGATADELLAHDRKTFGADAADFVSSVLSIADIYIKVDRIKDAEKILSSTLKRQQKNSVLEGQLLAKLGDVYTYGSQFGKAEKALQQATDILFNVAGEDSPEYISAALNLGILYMSKGKYPEAEEIFDVALSIIPPSEPTYADVLNNQGLVYKNLGQFERSEAIFKKIRKIDSLAIGNEHPDFAITLSNLGQVLTDGGKYAEAEKALLLALQIQKKNNGAKTTSYGKKLNNLARNYEMWGQPEKAIPHLEEALAIYKTTIGINTPDYATSSYNLGNAYWKAGKGSAGIKHLKTSATIRAKVLGKRHPKYAQSIQKIGEYQWEQKQIKDAHTSFGQVFENHFFQIETTFPGLTEEEKSSFFYNNVKGSFEKFNSFAVANSHTDPFLVDAMFENQVNTKGSIMYATEKVKKAILASNDSSLINLFENWHAKKEQIARSYSQNQDPAHLDSLVYSANLMEKELTKRSAEFAVQFNRKRVSWKQIQQLLKPGEACVEVIRYKKYSPEKAGKYSDEISYAFLIVTANTKDHPLLVVQTNGGDLENKFIKFYHNSIKYNIDDTRSYTNYFETLGKTLASQKIEKFYFSPDGVYNQLNINSLLNPVTLKYVVDEFKIHIVTNSKELLDIKEKKLQNEVPVLIGFPKFNIEKSTTTAPAEGNTTRGRTRGGLTRGMRGLLRFMRGDEGITELPGTQKEIGEISKLFGNKPKVYLEHQASEDVAKDVNNPPILHIATHGYFLEDEEAAERMNTQYVTNPLLKAGLILAGAENFLLDGVPVNAAGDDGVLTAYEAMNLKLDNTQLVVLSACETGLGEVKNGEGVYGLQRAFKLAGAKSIIMSLWSVDDDATQELMTNFYSELLKTGDQHEAFRKAQQKIKEKFVKPFYWGAFIMVGI
jgi:CHAT domain-containing protein/Tfp pilus assembly protein PilF